MLLFDLQFGNVGDDGLHRDGVEPLIGEEEDVLRKVEVFRGEGAAHIVVLVPAGAHERFDLFDDEIEAPLAVHRLSDGVMHFGAAVQREDDVLHLFVEESDGLIVEKKAVGRRREEEALAQLCGLLLGVVHGILDDAEVHEGLAAEEVHFEHLPLPALSEQKVDGGKGRLAAHHLALGVVRALVREAVLAAQVAVVRDVQTQRLHLVALHGVRLDLFLI